MDDRVPFSSMHEPKLYQVWQGNNCFCCGGRVMLGSSWGTFIWTNVILCVPFGFYIVTMLPALNEFLSIPAGLLFIVSLYNLWAAALTDPGIIPRDLSGEPPPVPDEAQQDDRLLQEGGIHPSGMVKYCDTCNLWRPRRAKHCRYCDNCVEKFDHHCPWVGNCVGARNYKHFLWFVISTLVLALYMAAIGVTQMAIKAQDETGDSWINRMSSAATADPIPLAITVYCIFITLSLLGLCTYHMGLIARNETTNEAIRGTFKRHENPFHRGRWQNCTEALWGDTPESHLPDLRQPVSTPTDYMCVTQDA